MELGAWNLEFMKKITYKHYILFFTIAAFATAAFGTMIYSGARLFFVDKSIFGGKKDLVCQEYGRLDGICLVAGKTEKYPVAVMIDNKFEARPWSGLSYAGLVYEAPVEGGITRFLAIYTTDREIKKIGPVRSVRPYYIDWAREFSALMLHIGGSPAALDEIADDPVLREKNIDALGEYFWRVKDRIAPHNAYTSSELLDKAREKLVKDGVLDFNFWKFKDDAFVSKRGELTEIKIKFSNYLIYDAVWEYNKERNIYKRKEGASYAQDEDGRMILAKNVAILMTDIEVIDVVSRREIKTVGSGDALVFQDGKKIEARWEKRSEEDRVYFFNLDGSDIFFNRGTTWVEVVDGLDKVAEK